MHSQLVESAFRELYPDAPLPELLELKYTGKLKKFNGNIKASRSKAELEIHLSSEWKTVSEDIQKGIVQYLLMRIYKTKRAHTQSMEMYDAFIKSLSKLAKVSRQDPVLFEAYGRINAEYFANSLEVPNLAFGSNSFSHLGNYTYATDTITLSSVFRGIEEKDRPMMEYVLYHEMLHKEHQFRTKNGRMQSHTREFRERERMFKLKDAEKELHEFVKRKKRQSRHAGLPKAKGFLSWLID